MKKLLSTLFILMTIVAQAQYHPFLENSSWIVKVYNFSAEGYYVTIPEGSDVQIGEYTYKKIFDPIFFEDIYFREDVVEKKVYKYVNGVDVIVFDFSLHVSDNITLENGINYTVSSITTISAADGTLRNVFSLYSTFNNEIWIEGIGGSGHPLKSFLEIADPYVHLSCSYQNGINVFHNGTEDCSNLLSSQNVSEISSEIKFAPNPFTSHLSITLKDKLENGTLKISNSLGQVVREIKNINEKEIALDRENLNAGVYFFQLFKNDKLLATKKLVISN